jgi:cyclopropane-fatty-acyl-phospholipid synthase
MAESVVKTGNQEIQAAYSFLEAVLGTFHPRNFSVRFWDGSTWEAEQFQEIHFTMVLNHPGSLRRMFWPLNNLTLGEAYIFNDFDIEGDMVSAFTMGDHFLNLNLGIADKFRYGHLFMGLPTFRHNDSHSSRLNGKRHSRSRDRQAVTHHYNLPSDFFSLFLDERMAYSCAYFTGPKEDIHQAQKQKLDYICRKLRLKPGERLLDVGCGWGSLIIHAAENYGVHATGITLSQPQADYAREYISRNGLEDRCRVDVLDYRDVKGSEAFDKVVSVGMVEHVGESNLPTYFRKAENLLKPGGAFLYHGIADSYSIHGKGGPDFIKEYVFPDYELVPINVSLHLAEKEGFEVRDVESLREHYALTLRHWIKRLEERHSEAVRLTDEITYRIWKLYMSGSAHAFEKGDLTVYQALLVKPDRGRSGLPLTRTDWYS